MRAGRGPGPGPPGRGRPAPGTLLHPKLRPRDRALSFTTQLPGRSQRLRVSEAEPSRGVLVSGGALRPARPPPPPLSEPREDPEAHAEASRVRDTAGGVGRASRWLSRPLAKAPPRGTRGQCVSGLRAPGLRAPGCVVPAATPGCPGRRLRARPHPSPSDKHSPAPDGQAPGCGRRGEQRISAFEFTVSGRDGP